MMNVFFFFFFKFTSKQNDGKVEEAASIGPIDWIVVSLLLYTHPLSSSFPPVIILSFDAGSTVVLTTGGMTT